MVTMVAKDVKMAGVKVTVGNDDIGGYWKR